MPDLMEDLTLQDFLNLTDIAAAAKKLEENVQEQLDVDKKKTALVQRLIEASKVRGDELTPEQAGVAVNKFFEGLYSFKAPEAGVSASLATLYADRESIWKNMVKPALFAGTLIGAIAGTGFLSFKTIRYASMRSEEKKVESRIESSYQKAQSAGNEVKDISSSPFRKQLPSKEKDQLEEIVSNSQRKLKEADPFFKRYCPSGNSADVVTINNYKAVENSFAPIIPKVDEAKTQADEGVSIIDVQKKLYSTKQSLDSLMAEIRHSNPIDSFKGKAEMAYNSGISCLENRKLGDAENYRKQLAEIKGDIGRFGGLKDKAQSLYKDILAVAKEDGAKSQGESIHSEASRYIEEADVKKLSGAVDRLQSIDSKLNQEYTLKIVSREGVKSGIDRHYNGSFSGNYIITEAIDSSGNALEMDITNIESGMTEKVSMWGEKVNSSAWEKVKADKMDNGIVDNNIVGYKKKGYMNEEKTMEGLEGGRITSW